MAWQSILVAIERSLNRSHSHPQRMPVDPFFVLSLDLFCINTCDDAPCHCGTSLQPTPRRAETLYGALPVMAEPNLATRDEALATLQFHPRKTTLTRITPLPQPPQFTVIQPFTEDAFTSRIQRPDFHFQRRSNRNRF